ncbi:MAG: hypothetical protein F4142_06735 [Nitrospira sp. SB0675_bin_23]|nr:hypothetical protein [Nitrospira sp. SB0675_bin_23]
MRSILLCLLGSVLSLPLSLAQAQLFPEDMPGVAHPEYIGPLHVQLPTLQNPNASCMLCIDSPPAGTFSERHYQRQQRTPSYTAPTLPSYDRGSTPGQYQYNHSLNDQAPRHRSAGADYWWPTPELQMQQDRLAIEEWKASQPSRCNSWSWNDEC